jgi:hypothetical protein
MDGLSTSGASKTSTSTLFLSGKIAAGDGCLARHRSCEAQHWRTTQSRRFVARRNKSAAYGKPCCGSGYPVADCSSTRDRSSSTTLPTQVLIPNLASSPATSPYQWHRFRPRRLPNFAPVTCRELLLDKWQLSGAKMTTSNVRLWPVTAYND